MKSEPDNRKIPILMAILFFVAFVLPALSHLVARRIDLNCTLYSPGYSHELFDRITVGMRSEDVIDMLGEPLVRRTCRNIITSKNGSPVPYCETWQFSAPPRPGGGYFYVRWIDIELATGKVCGIEKYTWFMD